MKATHKTLGPGTILKDKKGTCKPHEVLFAPDSGTTGRITPVSGITGGAFHVPATFDIFNKSEFTQE